jgi:tetratricopeptide (TPR) repeat protein
MSEFPELPLIINEASQQKYSRYTVYESMAKSNKGRLPRREGRNPFECLNRNPHVNTKCSYNNLKSLHLSRSRIENSPSLDFTLLSTLPPLASVTAPRGSAFKAYEEVHGFAREYLRTCGEETVMELSMLRRLHGSIASLNRRMEEVVRSGLVVLDPVLNIVFESIQAELALREERMQDAALYFRKAEFYSLKMQQYLFATHCLIEEADIFKSEGKLERGLASLKKALGVAILFNNQELQLTVLEKIGMLYYYNGNTAVGEQYHRYAERGLSPR